LWAHPATEDAAEYYRKQCNEDDEQDHPQPENEKILWPEYLAKQDKFSFKNINEE
jgi:hypothetical protein